MFTPSLPFGVASATSHNYAAQEGYDHSYFFIQTFIDEHIEHHASILKA